MCVIPYSEKLLREKTLANWRKKKDFCGENVCRLLPFAVPTDATPPNFVEKSIANSHKTVKFVKVFSLESFTLYDILSIRCRGYYFFSAHFCVATTRGWRLFPGKPTDINNG